MSAEEKEIDKAVGVCEEPYEFVVKKKLEAMRKEIKSFDDLIEFIKYVRDNCGHGYGEAPRSIAQASLAVAWYFASAFGITGFQGGATMWDFICGWEFLGNKCGLKIVDYDNLLFPQYGYKFDKTISSRTWEKVQEEAKNMIEEDKKDVCPAHHKVREHWESIANGNIPFGLTISDE